MIVISSALFIYLSVFLLKVVQVGTTDKLQFTIAYYCVKIWAVLQWVEQQQQFIPVVQVGTIENAAVLQVGITA